MLEVGDVTVTYGDTVAVRDVSLSVSPGTVVALIGPNGAGKTTLLRAISGTLKARSGTVSFDGRDLTGAPAHQRARLGLCHIPEGRGIFASLTVAENLWLQGTSGRADAVDRIAEIFPVLAERRNQVAGSMSGGEQQMLALARAYLRHPKLLLVDEASLGLAPVVIDQIFDFLATMVAAGSSLLLVEQYVNRALAMSQHAYIMSHGSIAYSGASADLSTEDVFAHYLGLGEVVDG